MHERTHLAFAQPSRNLFCAFALLTSDTNSARRAEPNIEPIFRCTKADFHSIKANLCGWQLLPAEEVDGGSPLQKKWMAVVLCRRSGWRSSPAAISCSPAAISCCETWQARTPATHV
jgi:hypothetical protein